MNVSIIIPVFNAEIYIKNCLDTLVNQNFYNPFEIIVVDDASTDNSYNIIKNYKLSNLKLFSLPSNSGPSAARNLGIKKATGEYIFFLDVDDSIELNTLEILHTVAEKTNCDFVCSDFKRIENSKNQRNGTYNYPSDMVFNNKEIAEAMSKELHDPSLGHLGLFGCNGRLIRRSILIDNNIFFEEKLKWFEDKTFCWDVLSFVRNARYIHKQLYSYYVYPNIKTNVIASMMDGFPLKYIKLINTHIRNGLCQRSVPKDEVDRLCKQGLIFHTILFLVSLSRSMVLGKIDLTKGKKIRRSFISEILNDNDILTAIKNYLPSKKESRWIPKTIALRSRFLLEIACNFRAKEVVKKRRKGKE